VKGPARLAIAALLLCGGGRAAVPGAVPEISDEGDGLRFRSDQLNAKLSLTHPALLFLGVDSLGQGKVDHDVLSADAPPQAAYTVTRSAGNAGGTLVYSRPSDPGAQWELGAYGNSLSFISCASASGAMDPLAVTFDTHRCYSTLLGLFGEKGAILLPAVLHLPGFGTLRLSGAGPGASVGYSSGPGWIRVTLPAATREHPLAAYKWEVTTVCPEAAGSGTDPRLDGYRRNWLNIFQLNPNRRLLSNNTNSDSCGFCYYEYADIARETPPLAPNLSALGIVRQSLEAVLGGTKTYGMPGYGDFPEESSDTYPSLLIAADDCVEGRDDRVWLKANYPAIRAMAEKMLATDRSGDGLIKYVATGNSGSWNEGLPKVRPSNWWDTIGFGYEDAYANALAYRALGGMRRMANLLQNAGDARRYGDAAARLLAAYFPAFFNPSTGLVAGWRSADGQLHDYAFTFVNGIAVLYGLVPADRARPVMDRLWERIRQAGYSDFRMGLPGNLVPVARRDYAHKDPRYGGGVREDNADGFQVYENGGATACFSYFAIAAFDRVGQHGRAEQVLLPILDAFEKREFEGRGENGMTNDWRKWDGTSEGYEGFLVDNYYVLLAAKQRQDRLLREQVHLDQADPGRPVLPAQLKRVVPGG
jgi:Bacterial alpha-L-rhamnosidase 6 hairpin glycosidase domain